MEQGLRQYYLNQLGIVGYYSRRQLPGAAPSMPETWVEEVAAEQGVVSVATAKSGFAATEVMAADEQETVAVRTQQRPASMEVRQAVEDIHSGLEQSGKRQRADTSAENGAPAANVAPAAQRQASFQLSVRRLASKVLIIDSVQPKQALPVNKLLQNIVAALGYSTKELGAAETLRWPLQHELVEAQTEDEGRAMLQAYYEAQLDRNDFEFLLLMGGQAIHYSLSAESVAGQDVLQLYGQSLKLEKFNRASGSVVAIMVPSLVEMLQQPQSKKITWRAIQPLRVNR